MKSKYEYDVALSFAGEDREYVEKVAIALKQNGINVFYDRFEEVNLWGKNLYSHLSTIYKDRANYTVLFISKYYAQKLWTNHERESAQARAFEENREYILPARFDDTEIPGVLKTVGYINLTQHLPDNFASLICKKVTTNSPLQPKQSHQTAKTTVQNVVDNDKKLSSLNQIQELINFASEKGGLDMTIFSAREWAMENFKQISAMCKVEDYISEMKELISFASSKDGLDMTAYSARNWASENHQAIRKRESVANYIHKMKSLINFANSDKGLGLTAYSSRKWAIENYDEHNDTIQP